MLWVASGCTDTDPPKQSDPGWDSRPQCAQGNDHICRTVQDCRTTDGRDGILYDYFYYGTYINSWCISDSQPTVSSVSRAFKELVWPASDMAIEPQGHPTVVNFPTNFYTTDTLPITQVIKQLGRRVTIEATPTNYTWIYGDGSADTTTDPGAPAPNTQITHAYLKPGEFTAQLDTTYAGRFRVGNGPWIAIPVTVKISGSPSSVTVVELIPKLVPTQ